MSKPINWDRLSTMIAEVVATREVEFISSAVSRGALTFEEARQVVEDWRPQVLEEIGTGIQEAFGAADAVTADAVNSAMADASDDDEQKVMQ